MANERELAEFILSRLSSTVGFSSLDDLEEVTETIESAIKEFNARDAQMDANVKEGEEAE